MSAAVTSYTGIELTRRGARRLLSGQSKAFGPWGLYSLAEINASYLTDGNVQIFDSPGIQLITSRLIIKAGVQLPVYQDMRSPRLERTISWRW